MQFSLDNAFLPALLLFFLLHTVYTVTLTSLHEVCPQIQFLSYMRCNTTTISKFANSSLSGEAEVARRSQLGLATKHRDYAHLAVRAPGTTLIRCGDVCNGDGWGRFVVTDGPLIPIPTLSQRIRPI
ncbi:hypothetical protein Hypma_001636 [Hypsizygus marmoreus]|uniref:Uncharacterized protein n=1 Tax=Hypsizygus marmoreus TaxID=39966 RepID=A0A369JAF8_HYPMA|nr:hypothetical protein Hypma_001636 [Hypsizygus marmoreus]